MKIFTPKRPNLDAVALRLLESLGVKVNGGTIRSKLQDHPHYPSLLALVDSLTELNIASQTLRITKQSYNPGNLIFPFIAHLREGQGRVVLVKAIGKGIVYLSDETRSNVGLSEADFLNRWDGVCLFAEADETSGERGYLLNRFKFLLKDAILPLISLFSIIILAMAIAAEPFSWLIVSLSVVKFLGLVTCVLLLVQSVNANNPFIQNLCGLSGKTTCNALLKSEAAKVNSWLNWSEVGFFYFAGSLLSLVLIPSSLVILVGLTLSALPYTVYSILYQYRRKNWCILCCCVQLILWMELLSILMLRPGIDYVESLGTFSTSFTNGVALITCFAIPVMGWSFIKPFFLDAAKLKPLEQQLKKFKYNTELFKQALTGQTKYAIKDELSPIVLGNPQAETVITMVSNPFCGPCGKAHQVIDSWLKKRNDIQLKVVFTTANEDNDSKTKVARHISALSTLKDKTITEKALNDWYGQSTRKYETWAERYPVTLSEEIAKITEHQKAWCKMAEITVTPTIFVNGYKLPEPYRLEDIQYLLN